MLSRVDIASDTITLPSSALRKLLIFVKKVRNAAQTMRDLGKCAAFVSKLAIKKGIINLLARTTQRSWEHHRSRLRRGVSLHSSRGRKVNPAALSRKAQWEQHQGAAAGILGRVMAILLRLLPHSSAVSDWLVDS